MSPAIYHNDCMYLAHRCLTLGRQRLYPLAERLLGALNGEGEKSKLASLQGLAAISTLQLVSPLRQTATTVLLDHLRPQREVLRTQFAACHHLKVRVTRRKLAIQGE